MPPLLRAQTLSSESMVAMRVTSRGEGGGLCLLASPAFPLVQRGWGTVRALGAHGGAASRLAPSTRAPTPSSKHTHSHAHTHNTQTQPPTHTHTHSMTPRCDVVLTKDLHLVCRHEPNVNESTTAWQHFAHRAATYTIDGEASSGIFAHDLTLEELRSLRAVQRLPFRDQSHNGRWVGAGVWAVRESV